MLTSTLEQKTINLTKKVSIEMILCPPGEFMMGSPKDPKYGDPSEDPQSLVTIKQPFWLGKHPITQRQWKAVMGKNPSRFGGSNNRPNNPVEQVSWYDCKEFTGKLGDEFSLPTEAQWEYACRAGSATRFFYGFDRDFKKLSDYAWYYENSNDQTHPVGQLKPNPWGFYDIIGNVLEWCQDIYLPYPYHYSKMMNLLLPKDSLRVLRGGAWFIGVWLCRSAYRVGFDPLVRSDYGGLRVVLHTTDS